MGLDDFIQSTKDRQVEGPVDDPASIASFVESSRDTATVEDPAGLSAFKSTTDQRVSIAEGKKKSDVGGGTLAPQTGERAGGFQDPVFGSLDAPDPQAIPSHKRLESDIKDEVSKRAIEKQTQSQLEDEFVKEFSKFTPAQRNLEKLAIDNFNLFGVREFLSRHNLHPGENISGLPGFFAARERALQRVNEDAGLLEKAVGGLTQVPKVGLEFLLASKILKPVGALGQGIVRTGATFGLHEAAQAPREGETLSDRKTSVGKSGLTGLAVGAVGKLIDKIPKLTKVQKTALRVPAMTGGFGAATYAETGGDIDATIEAMVTVLGFEAIGLANGAKTVIRAKLAGKDIAKHSKIFTDIESDLRSDIERAKAHKKETGVFPDDILDKYVRGNKTNQSEPKSKTEAQSNESNPIQQQQPLVRQDQEGITGGRSVQDEAGGVAKAPVADVGKGVEQKVEKLRKQQDELNEKLSNRKTSENELRNAFEKQGEIQSEIENTVVSNNLDKSRGKSVVRLTDQATGKSIIIGPSAKESGRFQATLIDNKGAVGDMTFDTMDEAIRSSSGVGKSPASTFGSDTFLFSESTPTPPTVKESLKVPTSVQGVEGDLVESKTIDGVEFMLFKGKDGKSGAYLQRDNDLGKTVTTRSGPQFEALQLHFNRQTAEAEKLSQPKGSEVDAEEAFYRKTIEAVGIVKANKSAKVDSSLLKKDSGINFKVGADQTIRPVLRGGKSASNSFTPEEDAKLVSAAKAQGFEIDRVYRNDNNVNEQLKDGQGFRLISGRFPTSVAFRKNKLSQTSPQPNPTLPEQVAGVEAAPVALSRKAEALAAFHAKGTKSSKGKNLLTRGKRFKALRELGVKKGSEEQEIYEAKLETLRPDITPSTTIEKLQPRTAEQVRLDEEKAWEENQRLIEAEKASDLTAEERIDQGITESYNPYQDRIDPVRISDILDVAEKEISRIIGRGATGFSSKSEALYWENVSDVDIRLAAHDVVYEESDKGIFIGVGNSIQDADVVLSESMTSEEIKDAIKKALKAPTIEKPQTSPQPNPTAGPENPIIAAGPAPVEGKKPPVKTPVAKTAKEKRLAKKDEATYINAVKLSADTPGTLRPQDLERVMGEFEGLRRGHRFSVNDFGDWLLSQDLPKKTMNRLRTEDIGAWNPPHPKPTRAEGEVVRKEEISIPRTGTVASRKLSIARQAETIRKAIPKEGKYGELILIEFDNGTSMRVINSRNAMDKDFVKKMTEFAITPKPVSGKVKFGGKPVPTQKNTHFRDFTTASKTAKEIGFLGRKLEVSKKSPYDLNQVMIESDTAVVTDGHLMFVKKGNYKGQEGFYSPEGKRIDKPGRFVKNWQDIIPSEKTHLAKADLQKSLHDLKKTMSMIAKGQEPVIRVYANPDETIGFTYKHPETGTAKVHVTDDAKLIRTVDPKKLEALLSTHLKAGSRQAAIRGPEDLSEAMIIEGDNRDVSVLMPRKSDTQDTFARKYGDRREAGKTILLSEASAGIANVAKTAVATTSSSQKIAKRLLSRGTRWMDTLGEGGRFIADGIRRVDQRASKRAKTNEIDTRNVIKLFSKKQREVIGKIINGRIKDQPESLTKAANQLRDILDRDMKAASDLGMQRRLPNGKKIPIGGSGKALPQVPNKAGFDFLEAAFNKGLADSRVYKAAEDMVRAGKAETVEIALTRIQQYRDSLLRGANPYLESTRLELPVELVEWDVLKVLTPLFERTALTVEGVAEWGVNFERLSKPLEQISTEFEPAKKHIVDSYIKTEFGLTNNVPRADAQLAGTLSNYQTITKLGLSVMSVLRNMGQRFVNTSTYPLSIQLKAAKDFPPIANLFMKSARKLKEDIERTGAVRSATMLSEIENLAPGQKLTTLVMKPFSSVETGNQVTTSLIAEYGLERDIDLYLKQKKNSRLKKVMDSIISLGDKSPGAVKRRLKRSGSTDLTDEQLAFMLSEQNGKMTPEQIEAAMTRLVTDTQFPVTMATKRIWWKNHPWMRLMFKFKPFAVEQTGMIYGRIVKETAKGNLAPMVRFVAWTILMGELYNIVRDALTGREESVLSQVTGDSQDRSAKNIAIHMAKDLVDGGGVGILADITWGIWDTVLGPTASSAKNATKTFIDSLNRPSQTPTAIRNFFENEVAVARQIKGVANRIDKKLGNENNTFFEYQKWRDRSFDFKDKKQTGGTVGGEIKKGVLDTIQGRQSFARTDRTLTYEYAARQVTAGDIDDATDYLAAIMEDVKTVEDKKALIKGIKTSMRSKSPLGKVSKKDQEDFLSKFSGEDQLKGLALQKKWLANYDKAIEDAAVRTWGSIPRTSRRRSRSRSRR